MLSLSETKLVNCSPQLALIYAGSFQGKLLLIVPNDFQFEGEYALFGGRRAAFIPPPKEEFFSPLPQSKRAAAEKIKVLWRVSQGLEDVVVAAASSLFHLPPLEKISSSVLSLHRNEEFEQELLVLHLRELGYREVDFVREIGEFSLRGGIVDFFSGWEDAPIRLEFSGDKVLSIRKFNPSTQLSEQDLKEAIIGPYREYGWKEIKNIESKFTVPLDEEAGEIIGLLSHYSKKYNEVFKDFAVGIFNREEIENYLEEEKVRAKESPLPYPDPSSLLTLPQEPALEFCCQEGFVEDFSLLPKAKGGMEAWRKWLTSEKSAGKRIILAAEFKGLELAERSPVKLKRGFHLRNLLVIGEENIPGHKHAPVEKIKKLRRAVFNLEAGSPVVHEDYGIGIFRGLVSYEGELKGDFLEVEFAGGEKLYVPVEGSFKLHPYNIPPGAELKLDRLSSPRWGKLKSKVRRSIQALVESMVKLYAERKAKEGFAFRDDPMLQDFISDFPYEETPDQARAWQEVKNDLMAPFPMDRLIVGDVGFGKTEIAMRAAFMAVLNGRQVALLAPTTVLALQHYRTFSERFKRYPVRIGMLSRMLSRAQQKEVLRDLADGKIDIIIGTHKLLSDEVGFKNLGLLIIDEEQRFGVKQKEKLRQLKKDVNCLSLTATPIPRTLSLALFSVWDISLIQTPPKGRQSVETFVLPFRKQVFLQAIKQELEREGQVYIVMNRIEEIPFWQRFILEEFPHLPLLVLHGRMKPSVIEKGIIDFMEGRHPVLLTTTIIENGIDIPNVNTLIVLRAENLGLAQLHQLRGRVGRSHRKAYAYFFVHDVGLGERAQGRLRAIREHASLGSGFAISMADLNIRGGGTLFGTAQHGHLAELGYDYYLKLLEEEIAKVSGAKPRAEVNLGFNVRIPPDYIPDPLERVNYYREITSAQDEDYLKNLRREMEDKYGKIPSEAEAVFSLGRISALATSAGISSLERRGKEIYISFREKPDPWVLYKFLTQHGGRFQQDGIILPAGSSVFKVEEILRDLIRILK